jgi:hypothetical protein
MREGEGRTRQPCAWRPVASQALINWNRACWQCVSVWLGVERHNFDSRKAAHHVIAAGRPEKRARGVGRGGACHICEPRGGVMERQAMARSCWQQGLWAGALGQPQPRHCRRCGLAAERRANGTQARGCQRLRAPCVRPACAQGSRRQAGSPQALASGPAPSSIHVPLPESVQPLAHLQAPPSQRPWASQVSTPDTTQLPTVGAAAVREKRRVRRGGVMVTGVWVHGCWREACHCPHWQTCVRQPPGHGAISACSPALLPSLGKYLAPWAWPQAKGPQESLEALTLALARQLVAARAGATRGHARAVPRVRGGGDAEAGRRGATPRP